MQKNAPHPRISWLWGTLRMIAENFSIRSLILLQPASSSITKSVPEPTYESNDKISNMRKKRPHRKSNRCRSIVNRRHAGGRNRYKHPLVARVSHRQVVGGNGPQNAPLLSRPHPGIDTDDSL